jgi:hypothetical protein
MATCLARVARERAREAEEQRLAEEKRVKQLMEDIFGPD